MGSGSGCTVPTGTSRFCLDYLARSGADEIQLDLFLDYASNVALYPVFQEYFRTSTPLLLPAAQTT